MESMIRVRTNLSLYQNADCPANEEFVSLIPTSADGNCTTINDDDNYYGFKIEKLGTDCNVEFFGRRNCVGSFAKHAYLYVCNGFNGVSPIESIRLVGCEDLLPDPSITSTHVGTTATNTRPRNSVTSSAASKSRSDSPTSSPHPPPNDSRLVPLNAGAILGIALGSMFGIVALVLLVRWLSTRSLQINKQSTLVDGTTEPLLEGGSSQPIAVHRESQNSLEPACRTSDANEASSWTSEATEGPSARLNYLERLNNP